MSDEDVVEAIAMLNVAVTIPEEMSALFPTSTRELAGLKWVDENNFLNGYRERNVNHFFKEQVNEVMGVKVCVHGLCLATTALGIELGEHKT